MPVDTPHPTYVSMQDKWRRCRDAFAGLDAIQAAGVLYLPKLDGQSPTSYQAYLKRATWYGAMKRTVIGLTGAVMRKEPTVEGLDQKGKDFLKDVTMTGTPFPMFAKSTLESLIKVGRVGVLVDLPATEARGEDVRPYWCAYECENIINWRVETIKGKPTLTKVVLKECGYVDDGDEFSVRLFDRYKVLRLTDGVYTMQEYSASTNDVGQRVYNQAGPIVTPVMKGGTLDFIPFCIINTSKGEHDCEDPPLLDLADMNLSHFRSSADLEHGMHFTALPTVYAIGFGAPSNPNNQNSADPQLSIGPGVCWQTETVGASCGILEFTGQGLNGLSGHIESKEKKMAVLGARMLEQQQPDVEAADTIRTRNAGEHSILQTMALTCSLGLTKVLKWTMDWMGAQSEKVEARLNADFVSGRMTSTDLTALLQTWQGGGISFETFYWNLERGEMTRPGITAKVERQLIEMQGPADLPLQPSDSGFTDPQNDPTNDPAKKAKSKQQQPPESVGNA